MKEPFRRAEKLTEVAKAATLEPLALGDNRYIDLSAGRDTKELRKLRVHLEDQSARDLLFAKIGFIGHRGCGKSTELLRLEHDVADRFFPLHLYVDETLLRDLDYTDLLLWLVDSLTRKFAEADMPLDRRLVVADRFFPLHLYVDETLLRDLDYTDLLLWLVDSLTRKFAEADMPLDRRLVNDVAEWFAEVTKEEVAALTTSMTADAELEGSAKLGLFATGLKILARLKSSVSGSSEQRRTIRSNLQRYSGDLIARVNGLLDDAARALEKAGKQPDLLIVQDNLDRLSAEAARRLFIDNGDLLKDLRAHFIFTAPVPLIMSPGNIGRVFEHVYTMPMVKTHRPNGKVFKVGLDALIALVAQRVDLDKVFTSKNVVRSSGSDVGRQRARSHAATRSGAAIGAGRRQGPHRRSER